MLDFLVSLEGLTTIIAFVAAVWGLANKMKASRALRRESEVRAEAAAQRKRLLDEIQELSTDHERELNELNERMDAATQVAREELAAMRGQIGKLMDMILSEEDLKVEADGENVKITGSAGEVEMKEKTLNKVAEATTGAHYKRGMGGSLKRVPAKNG